MSAFSTALPLPDAAPPAGFPLAPPAPLPLPLVSAARPLPAARPRLSAVRPPCPGRPAPLRPSAFAGRPVAAGAAGRTVLLAAEAGARPVIGTPVRPLSPEPPWGSAPPADAAPA
ncbi:hypothetical protein [Asanoa sp. NPDC050611]|uniref:hypothetical protein n=1 Tax=Asanoa sp. NPDC050611 TaxID=3157098 RepID=UPI0033E949B8